MMSWSAIRCRVCHQRGVRCCQDFSQPSQPLNWATGEGNGCFAGVGGGAAAAPAESLSLAGVGGVTGLGGVALPNFMDMSTRQVPCCTGTALREQQGEGR